VDSVRGGHGIDYQPSPRKTDHLPPQKAAQQIARHIQEVGRRLQRRDLKRVSRRNVKSRGKTIAELLEPERARRFNSSLDYFFSMVDCQRSGCEHPNPTWE
jgi:hypothetical protein